MARNRKRNDEMMREEMLRNAALTGSAYGGALTQLPDAPPLAEQSFVPPPMPEVAPVPDINRRPQSTVGVGGIDFSRGRTVGGRARLPEVEPAAPPPPPVSLATQEAPVFGLPTIAETFPSQAPVGYTNASPQDIASFVGGERAPDGSRFMRITPEQAREAGQYMEQPRQERTIGGMSLSDFLAGKGSDVWKAPAQGEAQAAPAAQPTGGLMSRDFFDPRAQTYRTGPDISREARALANAEYRALDAANVKGSPGSSYRQARATEIQREMDAEGAPEQMTPYQRALLDLQEREQTWREDQAEMDRASAQEDAAAEAKAAGDEAFSEAYRIGSSMMASYENISEVAGDVAAAANPWTTGIVGSLAGIVPQTGAFDLKANVDTLKADAAFGALQEMRNNNKTGGALGQVSNIELNLLEKSKAALDASQSEPQFRKNLDRYMKQRQKTIDSFYGDMKNRFGEERASQIFGGYKPQGSGTPRASPATTGGAPSYEGYTNVTP